MPRRTRLIERREQLGLTQAQVAERAGCAVGSYARYEAGASTPRAGDRVALAAALEWSLAELAVALSDGAALPVNGHAVPGWLGHLASLEQGAARLCAFEATTVHGLLQTAAYATAVERADAVSRSEEGIARRVRTRLARQRVLHREPDPLSLAVILDESILYRIAGDVTVMADQLEHLAAMSDLPNVDLRVLPFRAGAFVFGSFTLFTQPGASEPYMAITEDRAGPHYHDRPNELEAHAALFQHLTEVALTPGETVDLITAVAKETRS